MSYRSIVILSIALFFTFFISGCSDSEESQSASVRERVDQVLERAAVIKLIVSETCAADRSIASLSKEATGYDGEIEFVSSINISGSCRNLEYANITLSLSEEIGTEPFILMIAAQNENGFMFWSCYTTGDKKHAPEQCRFVEID